MKSKHLFVGLSLALSLMTIPLSAQKTVPYLTPEAVFDEGVLFFQNKEYGAAIESFDKYLKSASDNKSQKVVDAQYYQAVSSMYLGTADAEAKVTAFVNENPGSTWAEHANFLYANMLFNKRKYRDALSYYENTDVNTLAADEQQQMKFNMAYSYFSTDRVEQAEPLFKELSQTSGKFKEPATYYYAHILYANKKDSEALDNFNRLVGSKAYGKVVPPYIMQINYRTGNYDAVIADADRTLRNVDPKRKADVAMVVADAWYQKQNYPKALEYYEIYRKNTKGKSASREAYYQMGVSRMKTDDYDGAIADLQRAAGGNDEVGQYASYYLASCYNVKKEDKYARNAYFSAYTAGVNKEVAEESLFDYAKLSMIPGVDPFNEAVAQLDEYVEKNPDSKRRAEAEEMAVYLLVKSHDYDNAFSRLENMKADKSKDLSKLYNQLLYSTGIDNFRKGNYEKSQDYFQKIMNSKQSGEQKAEACFWYAEAAYLLGDYTTAEAKLKQFKGMNGASRLDEYVKADYDLGYISYQRTKYDAAIASFNHYVAKAGDSQADMKGDAYMRLGDCYYMKRNYAQAVSNYDLAMQYTRRGSDYALYQQGMCYGAQGNVNKKVESLAMITQKYPSSQFYDKALFEIGNTYLVRGDNRAAIASFDKLIKDKPRSSYTRQSLMKIGMIYYNNDQNDQALSTLQKLISNYPNTDESREALAIVRNIYMEGNRLDEYFAYTKAAGVANIEVTQKDSLAFANAQNFYRDADYKKADEALKYYISNYPDGAYMLKAHQYALVCAEKLGNKSDQVSHLEYIVSQPDSDYTDEALLKLARIRYEASDYVKAGELYERLASITEQNAIRLEALEGSMKSNFFMSRYDKAVELGQTLAASQDITADQMNQINHILGKSYFQKGKYDLAATYLDKSAANDKSVYGAESAYYSAEASLKLKNYDMTENKVFDISEKFSDHTYWVAKSFILLADVYVAKDNFFQAKETLRSVIDNYKGDDLRNEARRKLQTVEGMEKKGK